MGKNRVSCCYISGWNKKQLLFYFEYFLDLCYRGDGNASSYIKDWKDFFEQSAKVIEEDVLEGEKHNPSAWVRRLTITQENRVRELNDLETKFYKKWIGTKFEELFFTKSYYQHKATVDEREHDSFTRDGKPIQNKLWLEFVEEFGMTPVDEVERYFDSNPAVRRKVARKKRGKDYSAKK